MPSPTRKTDTVTTRDRLLAAAGAAFNAHGYFGTDTNRIARAAGYAPQTFYRHFADKLDVFLAVYAAWREAEAQAVRAAVLAERAPPRRAAVAADAMIAFHRDWAVFRRSLRLLALEEAKVRAARAASRAEQVDALARLPGNARRTRAALLAAVLTIERLCDAAADHEPEDLEVAPEAWRAEIVRAVRAARGEA